MDIKIIINQKAPEGGWRLSPPACVRGFANFRKFKSPVTLTLTGQGDISIHITCSTTGTPNHLTVASRSTEIWLFECREMWIFGEVWTVAVPDVMLCRSWYRTDGHTWLPIYTRSSPGDDVKIINPAKSTLKTEPLAGRSSPCGGDIAA